VTIPHFTPTFENGGYWEYYRDLERQFENFLEFVPYLSGNENTYSFRLANLVLAIGAHVDSAFKEIAKYPDFSVRYPEILNPKTKTGKKRKSNITDYYPISEAYKLSQRKVMFKCLPEREPIIPFQQYTKVGGKVITPDWWQVYNSVKHKFSENFGKATLRNTRDALVGAFLLNIIHTPAYIRLVEYRIVTPDPIGRTEFTLIAGWQDRFKQDAKKDERFGFIETPLFSYKYYEEPALSKYSISEPKSI
jgi:hypothetical protein